MLNTPFPPWPSVSDEEVAAVTRVLRSNRVNYWTGCEGREFETEFAAWSQAAHAIAFTNGTVALEAALVAAGIGSGDEVVVTPRSFMASVSCVPFVGAVPVFTDVDRDTQNITAESIEQVLTKRTRAIIPVHLGGMPCDMDPIMDIARNRGLIVIEDCAQAHGATYKGRSVGSIGDVNAWSFCQDKIMTTGGEGGMITTNSHDSWSAAWSYKDHGKNCETMNRGDHPPGFRWVHESFGTNGRMLEVQAAIGRVQLLHVAEWSAVRRKFADSIWSAARDVVGLRAPEIPAWATHAAYRAYVFVEPDALREGWSRDRILAEVVAAGVPCYSGSCSEIYLEKAFDNTGWRPAARLPVARELGETSLAFLVHPTLDDSHIEKTCETLRSVMRTAVR